MTDHDNLQHTQQEAGRASAETRVLEYLNAMVADGIEPVRADMTLGTLILEKSLYPDLIAESFTLAIPDAEITEAHLQPERSIAQVVGLLISGATPPPDIAY